MVEVEVVVETGCVEDLVVGVPLWSTADDAIEAIMDPRRKKVS